MRIFGVILAGGQARRMGGADKAFVSLSGLPLIRIVMDRFQPQVERVAISANGDPARFDGFSDVVLPDAAVLGPLSGILSALDWAAREGAGAVVSVPVDAPFLPPDLVAQLLLAAGAGPAIATQGGRDHPVFGLWPVALADDLRAFLASGAKPKVTDFCDRHATARACFDDPAAFINLNSPDDLGDAEALVRGR